MPELKTRNPFGVWVLNLVTIGIYGLVWAHKTCQQVQAVSPQNPKNVSPAGAVLSMIFGGFTLMIWPAINWFNFCASMRAQQQAAGLQPTFSTGVATLLVFVVSTHTVYVQGQQNLVVQAVQQRQGAVA
ncbi:DUF4234 domain-containing protein [Glycomyces xiaoerkulensis]|uniref:DUF4234 domain-containing protein n=1 Tax=Glycomyces xiaoerkulensis TaxID=2038139 RepID=UPI000C25D945|nr:DUF4234 domain-containing protein [Glycomyces xiaoerkulensis]